MLTVEIPADIVIETFDRAADNTTSCPTQAVKNGWYNTRKDRHPLIIRELLDLQRKKQCREWHVLRTQANCPWETVQKIPPTIHKGRYSVDKMQLTAPESVFWPRISGDILRQPKVAMCVIHFIRANSDRYWCHMKFPKDYGSTSWSWLRITRVDFPRS